jgi:hypothetical protein
VRLEVARYWRYPEDRSLPLVQEGAVSLLPSPLHAAIAAQDALDPRPSSEEGFMRATLIYCAGDVRVETVPDPV